MLLVNFQAVSFAKNADFVELLFASLAAIYEHTLSLSGLVKSTLC